MTTEEYAGGDLSGAALLAMARSLCESGFDFITKGLEWPLLAVELGIDAAIARKLQGRQTWADFMELCAELEVPIEPVSLGARVRRAGKTLAASELLRLSIAAVRAARKIYPEGFVDP